MTSIFFADNNFSQATSRLSLAKMTSFSMSPAAATSEQRHHVVAFVAGQKGGPAIAKLFGYPRFNPEKDAIISKSFFNADKLETEWSKGFWPFISIVNYFSIPRLSSFHGEGGTALHRGSILASHPAGSIPGVPQKLSLDFIDVAGIY